MLETEIKPKKHRDRLRGYTYTSINYPRVVGRITQSELLKVRNGQVEELDPETFRRGYRMLSYLETKGLSPEDVASVLEWAPNADRTFFVSEELHPEKSPRLSRY